jgi:hypothetical protein
MSGFFGNLFGTPLERAQAAYDKHAKKYNECTEKASNARTNGNYDYADSKSREADSHLEMMGYYDKVISRLLAESAEDDEDELG